MRVAPLGRIFAVCPNGIGDVSREVICSGMNVLENHGRLAVSLRADGVRDDLDQLSHPSRTHPGARRHFPHLHFASQ